MVDSTGAHPPIVTILFTDLVGSTALLDQLGDEAADKIRRVHFSLLRGALVRYGGREIKSLGDGLMVAFSSAVGAIRCAIAMQHAVERDTPGVLRVGIDAGEPISEGGDLYGTPVVVAKRLCELAGGGEILASDLVCRLAGRRVSAGYTPLDPVAVKGLSTALSILRIEWRDAEPHELPVSPPSSPRTRVAPRWRRMSARVLASVATALLAAGIVVALEATGSVGGTASAGRSDGSEQRFLAPGSTSAEHPCYLGDSGRILFTLYTSGYNRGASTVDSIERAAGPSRTIVDHSGNEVVNAPGGCQDPHTGRIVFSSDLATTDNVYTAAAGRLNSALHRVTCYTAPTLHAIEPSFSPNGRSIVYALVDDRHAERSTLWTIPAGNACVNPVAPKRIVPGPPDCARAAPANGHEPNFSPTGREIVFQRESLTPNGPINLWTVHPDGCDLTQITSDGNEDTDPSFSPDGRTIVYSTDYGSPTGIANLFLVAATPGAHPVRLTSQCYYDGAPSFSSDGRWVSYESWPVLNPGGSDIATAIWRIAATNRPGTPTC